MPYAVAKLSRSGFNMSKMNQLSVDSSAPFAKTAFVKALQDSGSFLSGGEGRNNPCPPHSNTGGIGAQGVQAYYQRNNDSPFDSAFIDWLNFTIKADEIKGFSDDEKILLHFSAHLETIFGFGVTFKRHAGMMFYKDSYVLGNGWGFVCIGGQNDTILLSLNGAGCMAAKSGWEAVLHDYLSKFFWHRLTRVDLAHDFFDGEYTVDQALDDFKAGSFSLGARPPEVAQHGNWITPSGKGRTLAVGTRGAGKMARVYEKGLQLGAQYSNIKPNWVRVEVELRCDDRVIPLDVLLHSGQYLAATYPAFSFISSAQKRITVKKNTVQILYQAAVHHARSSCGKLLNVMRNVEDSIESVIDLLVRDGMPKRLKMASDDYQHAIPSLPFCTESLDDAFAMSMCCIT